MHPGHSSRLAAAAHEWMTKNPTVMARFIAFSLEAQKAGHQRLSIALLVERVRWFGIVEHRDADFKISNNHRAYIAREIMRREPLLNGFFCVKELRSDVVDL